MTRRLFRSRTQRVIGGVCGGLGEYFNIDPNLIRVAFIVLAFFQGLGIIAYLAMWLIFPRQVPQEEPEASPPGEGTAEAEAEKEPLFRPRPQRDYWLGLVLIIAGLLWLFQNVFNNLLRSLAFEGLLPSTFLWWPVILGVWPLLLVAAGIIILIKRAK